MAPRGGVCSPAAEPETVPWGSHHPHRPAGPPEVPGASEHTAAPSFFGVLLRLPLVGFPVRWETAALLSDNSHVKVKPCLPPWLLPP